jgi:hypothetical protein
MKVMPEKEPSIRKKIAKLEERKRTEAATPADVNALKGTHRTRTRATVHVWCVCVYILSINTCMHTTHSPLRYYSSLSSVERRAKKDDSTPFQPSSLSSLMQSLTLSDDGKSKSKTLLTGPKKLSFDSCDDHNNASGTKQPATRKVRSPQLSKREKEKKKPTHAPRNTTAHAHAHAHIW